MKKAIKISLTILLGSLIGLLLLIQYLRSDLNSSFDQMEIDAIVSKVKDAPNLPDKFIQVYNEIETITNTSGVIRDQLFTDHERNCPCLEVARISGLTNHKNQIAGNRYILSWKLEMKITQRECLNYLASRFDFLYYSIGIEDASMFYFEKPLESLTTEQMQILTLMFKNPVLYNPKRNPDNVQLKLKQLRS